MAAETPMMKQYRQLKSQYQDAILFFRLGDFYEMFEQDALMAVEILGITLTARSKGEDKIPMCGIPYHSAARYIALLNKAGKRVAICEQVSDPNLKGIVERQVVRVITPGTTLDDNLLNQKAANYLCAWKGLTLAFADISTGDLQVISLDSQKEVEAELSKIQPIELLHWEMEEKMQRKIKGRFADINFYAMPVLNDEEVRSICGTLPNLLEGNWQKEQLVALAMLLKYVQDTQKTDISHVQEVKLINKQNLLPLDEATIRNLELIESLREKNQEGSLLQVLDKTVTSTGARLLKQVLVSPLKTITEIEKRQQVIGFFLKEQNLLLDLREQLRMMGDLERMIGRLSLASGNARDLRGVAKAQRTIQKVFAMLFPLNHPQITEILSGVELLNDIVELIEKVIVEEPPFSIKDGGMIAKGYHSELDELKAISSSGKNFIIEMQAREIARTGISSLKIKYNKVFGYYIEISNANLKQVPEDYVRKQTLVNAERFSTPELKEYESKVLGAEEKIVVLEEQIFEAVKQLVLAKSRELKNNAQAIAWLDVLSTQSLVAWENHYVKPEIGLNDELKISQGRHPVIEKLNPTDRFIANDLELNDNEHLMLITGPNMGGKSTYLRQTAIIVLMAHLGFFVPAESAKIPLTDRIFSRVGASDNLVRGQSTFWLEMEETAYILANATPKSLVILDEIGRGTSTFDGVSLAWGIMEYLHNQIQAKTLFASHYHELINLAEELPRAANYSVQVQESEQGVVFLYQIARGGINKSYGLEVAKLAGIPAIVLQRAKEILADLEAEKIGIEKEYSLAKLTGSEDIATKNRPVSENYINSTDPDLEKLQQEYDQLQRKQQRITSDLAAIDINQLTPLQAMQKLQSLIEENHKFAPND